MARLKAAFIVLVVGLAAAAGYYYLRGTSRPAEVAYVLAPSAQLVDSRAEVHSVVGTVKNGQRLEVLERDGDWVRARLASGETGWLDSSNLMDSDTHQRAERLLQEIKTLHAQAAGHTAFQVNLHLEPSRSAPILNLLSQQQPLEIYGRRLVARLPAASEAGGRETPQEQEREPSAAPREAWYLVRAGSHGGWVLGRLVTLDPPEAISVYAQNINLVAWLALDTVQDQGHAVPQYLVADRIGTQEADFNHIRVFTWWAKRQRYATAYVESNLQGFFPIRVEHRNNVPYFRLRLLERGGREVQKVYELQDTIVRPLGDVEGWTSDALPERPARRSRRR